MKRVSILTGLGFGAFALSVLATGTWTAPASAPPNGNVDAPINTGATTQYKSGPLGIGASSGILPGVNFRVFGTGVMDDIITGTIQTTSNVGLGAAPAATFPRRLDVFGGYGLGVYDASSAMRFITSAGVNYIQSGTAFTSSAADLKITAMYGSPTWMTIKGATGNVGVGTEAPAVKLQVAGVTKADDFCLNSDGTKCLSTVSGGTPGISISDVRAAVEYVTNSNSAPTPLGGGVYVDSSVLCTSPKKIIGGGCSSSYNSGSTIMKTAPTSDNAGWNCSAYFNSGTGPLTATAICI